ncbi:MAG: protein adenylyltransferase SelO family protein, partial [Proteobacteria bacterium]|nr:protein adenylyltransferase SelO family protein [Pseudomonadota bacterium]
MNTDNMSILGLTIDYGPYGWLENYDPNWTPNTTDAQGRRYRFGQQAQIALWNLVQLANAIYPLVAEAEPLERSLHIYDETYESDWQNMMAQKLGLRAFETSDRELVSELFEVLALVETDMTLFFRGLAQVESSSATPESIDDQRLMAPLLNAYYDSAERTEESKRRMSAWIHRYIARVNRDGREDHERSAAMDTINPKYVFRNYLAQLAIDRVEEGDFSMVHDLLDVLRRPYDEHPGKDAYAEKRPDWARHRAGCSMLSCSS